MSEATATIAAGASPTDAVARIRMDDDGRLAEDVGCRHCGYNLRGLGVEGRCPECETPIGRSVHGDLLQFCDPGWVETLAGGMRLFVYAIVLGILFGIGVAIAAGISFATTGGMAVVVVFGLVTGAVLLTAVQLLAYWKITTPDPGRDETERAITTRAVARIALLVSGAVGLVTGLLDANDIGFALIANASPTFTAVRWTIAAGAAVLGLVGMGALFLYGISLARRLPDDAIARSTKTVMWGFLVTAGLIEAANLAMDALARGPNAATTAVVLGVLTVIVVIPGLVFWIWGIVLLFKYRNRLMDVAQRARATWAGV